jgi:hypothetical protein
MQRTLLIVCAALCALSVRAADSEAQIKARQALDQKLQELQSHPADVMTPAPTTAAPVTTTPKPAKQHKTTPATQSAPAPVVQAPAATTRPQPPAAASAPVLTPQPKAVEPTPVPAPAAVPQPVMTTPAPVATAPSTTVSSIPARPVPADPDAIEKARAAMRAKMSEVVVNEPPPPVAPTPAPEPAKPHAAAQPTMATASPQPQPVQKPVVPKPQKHPADGKMEFRPLEGPSSGLSASKQQQLSELLRKYRSDEISPEEYHSQRAKVLGEP